MRTRHARCILLLLPMILIACSGKSSDKVATASKASTAESTAAPKQKDQSPPSGVVISSVRPSDIAGGADKANITQAAQYAWNQFIALNWPAVEQKGQAGNRDTPDTSLKFGDQSRPLVWHTYRSKVEIYPWTTHLPPGATVQGDQIQFNYDALPQYYYNEDVPPCGVGSNSAAWINLDETSQISLNYMFNGSAGASGYVPSQSSSPTLIRFLAKSNRTYSDYITGKGYFNHGSNGKDPDYFQAVSNFTNAVAANTPADPNTIVQFPADTVMVKSAWRLLTKREAATGEFHTTTVRFYEKKQGKACYYQEETWGMVALHIVQKTPGAPTFTFATFEQKDNLKDTTGQPVEDSYGNQLIDPPNLGGAPTTPRILHTDSPTSTTTTADGSFCHPVSNPRLFYRNIPSGLPQAKDGDGGVCVNYRRNNIPRQVVEVNREAQQKILDYNQKNNVRTSPWANYKLVNIQFQPFNATDIDDSNPNRQTPTFYQANIVVETNNTLQEFAGRQTPDGQTSSFSAAGKPAINVAIPNAGSSAYNTYNMGGCMGCHGNAQVGGSDFSFTLREGPVLEPDVPDFSDAAGSKLRSKYKF